MSASGCWGEALSQRALVGTHWLPGGWTCAARVPATGQGCSRTRYWHPHASTSHQPPPGQEAACSGRGGVAGRGSAWEKPCKVIPGSRAPHQQQEDGISRKSKSDRKKGKASAVKGVNSRNIEESRTGRRREEQQRQRTAKGRRSAEKEQQQEVRSSSEKKGREQEDGGGRSRKTLKEQRKELARVSGKAEQAARRTGARRTQRLLARSFNATRRGRGGFGTGLFTDQHTPIF
ncbi:hypothetical protein NDU88_001482 [Pleurodeles waltl]|uniref:Uncharacterized protein n=1 Tax=Pleurodeles waltl TaxID=8319 RepID=A0AAV7TJS4_PLEWA|nr:hypothetical protein NDU88_001482 [Pleurodeles waltl]